MYAIQFREVTYSALDLFYPSHPSPYCIWCFPDRQFLEDTCMEAAHIQKVLLLHITQYLAWSHVALQSSFYCGQKIKGEKKKKDAKSIWAKLRLSIGLKNWHCRICLAHTQGKLAFFLLQGTFNRNSLASEKLCFQNSSWYQRQLTEICAVFQPQSSFKHFSCVPDTETRKIPTFSVQPFWLSEPQFFRRDETILPPR